MRHFILLAPLLLTACGTNNEQLAQNALAHDQGTCEARGYVVDSDDYVRCMRHLGGRVGYQLAKADDGSLAFVIPGPGPITNAGLAVDCAVSPAIQSERLL